MVGIRSEQEPEFKAWLQERIDIALLQAEGKAVSYAQTKLVQNDPLYPYIQEEIKALVEASGGDAAKLKENLENFTSEKQQAAIDGIPPRGFGETVMNAVSKKVTVKFDENDIAGSLGETIQSFSISNLMAGIKEGIKQALLSRGFDGMAAWLKSAKSHVFAALGKGEAQSVPDADRDLKMQSGMAQFAVSVGVKPEEANAMGNAMTGIFKKDMKSYDERKSATPAPAEGTKQKTYGMDDVLAAVQGLRSQLKPGQDLKTFIDGNKDGLVTNKEMLEFARSIIPESDGKLVSLNNEELSTLVSSLTRKDVAAASKGKDSDKGPAV